MIMRILLLLFLLVTPIKGNALEITTSTVIGGVIGPSQLYSNGFETEAEDNEWNCTGATSDLDFGTGGSETAIDEDESLSLIVTEAFVQCSFSISVSETETTDYFFQFRWEAGLPTGACNATYLLDQFGDVIWIMRWAFTVPRFFINTGVGEGSGSYIGTTSTINATNNYIWFHHDPVAGDLDYYVSDSGTKPSPDLQITNDDNLKFVPTKFIFLSACDKELILDNLQIDDDVIGDQ